MYTIYRLDRRPSNYPIEIGTYAYGCATDFRLATIFCSDIKIHIDYYLWNNVASFITENDLKLLKFLASSPSSDEWYNATLSKSIPGFGNAVQLLGYFRRLEKETEIAKTALIKLGLI